MRLLAAEKGKNLFSDNEKGLKKTHAPQKNPNNQNQTKTTTTPKKKPQAKTPQTKNQDADFVTEIIF